LDKRTGEDGKARPAKVTTRKPTPPSIDSGSYNIEEAIGARSLFDSQTFQLFENFDIWEGIGAGSLFDNQTFQLFENFDIGGGIGPGSLFNSQMSQLKSHTLPDINAMAVMPERPWDEEKQAWLDRRTVMAVDILIQSRKWRVNLVNLDNSGVVSWPLYAKADLDRLIADLQDLKKHLARKSKVQNAEKKLQAAVTVPRRGSEALERAKEALRNDPSLTKRALMKQTGASSKCAVRARKELQITGEIPTRAAAIRSKGAGG
jgi:hypothetical protein